METGQLNKLTLRLLEDGFVILPPLLSEAICDILNSTFSEIFSQKIQLNIFDRYCKNSEKYQYEDFGLSYNYFPGHFQLQIPNTHVLPDIIGNPAVMDIIHEIFGTNFFLSSYTCNANISQHHQPFHMDTNHHHSGKILQTIGNCGPPYQIIVNFYLEDVNEANGSLDIIPKSHQDLDFELDDEGRLSERVLNGKTIIHGNGKKGTIILRDKRTWHRGTPNPSKKPRFMISCTYTSGWINLGGNKLTFNKDCVSVFEEMPFSIWNIEFV